MENDQIEFLNVEETASLLKISIETICILAKQGRIPSRKVGKHWRFHRDTLLKWVAGEFSLNEDETSGG